MQGQVPLTGAIRFPAPLTYNIVLPLLQAHINYESGIEDGQWDDFHGGLKITVRPGATIAPNLQPGIDAANHYLLNHDRDSFVQMLKILATPQWATHLSPELRSQLVTEMAYFFPAQA